MKAMTIEIWSDIVCPWCYIGKRRFERALARFTHRDQVSVVWRSWQLDPTAPRQFEGTVNDVVAQKYGASEAQAAAIHEHLTALAAAEGLTFRFDRAGYGNTFDAHRLIHLGLEHGVQGHLKERLLRAYFTEGVPIGDPESLVDVVTEVGLDADRVRAVLAGKDYAEDIRGDHHRGTAFGVTGVPFLVINEKYTVSGAQSLQVYADVLERAWADSHPATQVGSSESGAGLCDDGHCVISPAQMTVLP